ncbi:MULTISPECIES: DUF3267 domain-containing protein [Staphylococcus]|mgnify:CR=1 FL=1|jgi:hypothetical protein|uniref:DUF3267 domain-containing protein n=1 Tax=Staphylococcus nepalensis TaxID=214473 RepID=A0A291JJI1_9STAP|nr:MULTISPECIES: DUF3267 domain-containing protein [Staphylococcus]VDG66673.1 Protein of uncharacterised function (DUF3267) [Lacrimispora indolis]ATH59715.1 permease [Staphylococcus nepalensis]ATH64806.1 permease [Staphylococcus nepalensis]AWI44174.1 permease [Staphylococcus nepalensis]MBO1206860.1 DUF3267 domain-containing protein [Staphylococcus nepalensis]
MFKIDLFSNKKLLEGFLLFQFTVVMISILLSYKFAYLFASVIEQNILFNLIYGILGFTVIYLLHELVHNLMFRLLSKGQKPTYRIKYGLIKSHMPQVYFKKWQYSMIMLAPLLIITLILFTLFSVATYSSIIFIASFHIGYCVRDIYLLSGVLNANVQYIEDTEDGIIYFTQNPSNQLQTDTKS